MNMDPRTLLTLLQQDDDRTVQRFALQRLSIIVVTSDSVERCFYACPPWIFMPALCRIFLDEYAPDDVLELTAHAIVCYLEVSTDCTQWIVAVDGAVKAFFSRLEVVDVNNRKRRDFAEQCVEVLELTCTRQSGAVLKACGDFSWVLPIILNSGYLGHNDILHSAMFVVSRLCGKMEPHDSRIESCVEALSILFKHEDHQVSDAALRCFVSLADRFMRRGVDPAPLAEHGLTAELVSRLGAAGGLAPGQSSTGTPQPSCGAPPAITSTPGSGFSSQVSTIVSLLSALFRGSPIVTRDLLRTPLLDAIERAVQGDDRCCLDTMRLVDLLLVLIFEGREALPRCTTSSAHGIPALQRLHSSGERSHRQLIDCIKMKDTDGLIDAIDAAAFDVNFMDDVGETLLIWASAFGTQEMVQFLCERGSDVNRGQYPPLLLAAIHGQPQVVKTLLKNGADPCFRDKDGMTPLDHARDFRHNEVVSILQSPEKWMCPVDKDQDKKKKETHRKEEIIEPRDHEMAPVYLKRFLPIFALNFQKTIVPPVKKASLALICKMVHHCPGTLLKEICSLDVGQNLPIILVEITSAVLHHEDDDDGHLLVLQMIDDLVEKGGDLFLDHLEKLGVINMVSGLAGTASDDEREEGLKTEQAASASGPEQNSNRLDLVTQPTPPPNVVQNLPYLLKHCAICSFWPYISMMANHCENEKKSYRNLKVRIIEHKLSIVKHKQTRETHAVCKISKISPRNVFGFSVKHVKIRIFYYTQLLLWLLLFVGSICRLSLRMCVCPSHIYPTYWPGVGFTVRVEGLGSSGSEFESQSAVELTPGGVCVRVYVRVGVKDLGLQVKTEDFFFNSRVDIGSFLVERLFIFQLWFTWESWAFEMALIDFDVVQKQTPHPEGIVVSPGLSPQEDEWPKRSLTLRRIPNLAVVTRAGRFEVLSERTHTQGLSDPNRHRNEPGPQKSNSTNNDLMKIDANNNESIMCRAQVRRMARKLHEGRFEAVESIPRGILLALRNIATRLECAWELHTSWKGRSGDNSWIKLMKAALEDLTVLLKEEKTICPHEMSSSGLIQALLTLLCNSNNKEHGSNCTKVLERIHIFKAAFKTDGDGGSHLAKALVRKLISVLESIERLPLYQYDMPGTVYNLQVLTRRLQLRLEKAPGEMLIRDITCLTFQMEPLATTESLEHYILNMAALEWFEYDRGTFAFVQKVRDDPTFVWFYYQHDFDENGIIYWIGTNARTAYEWINPAAHGLVSVSSTVGWNLPNGYVEDILSRDSVSLNCHTDNDVNAWFAIDLGLFVIPKAYTLRHAQGYRYSALRNWLFQASKDGYSWLTLCTHTDDDSLDEPGSTATWPLEPPKGELQGWRHIRLKQMGRNASELTYHLSLSGFELYGAVTAVCEDDDDNEEDEDETSDDQDFEEVMVRVNALLRYYSTVVVLDTYANVLQTCSRWMKKVCSNVVDRSGRQEVEREETTTTVENRDSDLSKGEGWGGVHGIQQIHTTRNFRTDIGD
uniref:E3 ubiquitin-protein ligase HECTD1-like n=1 Tax=Myxine glutinosa TaxID=7769 RepID=UPI00358E560E